MKSISFSSLFSVPFQHITSITGITSRASVVAFLLILVTLTCLPQQNQCAKKKVKRKLNFELDIPRGCEVISFPNATINDCGYCVNGDTGLVENYGKDCKGVCFGQSTLDCDGVCDGKAYIDECTGICITPDDVTRTISNATTNRDCRGLCIQSATDHAGSVPISSQVYDTDQCGICRLPPPPPFNAQNGPNSFDGVNQPPPSTQSIDCNGNCQLPGLRKSSIVCGHCVRQSELFNVIDECGNCLSEGHPCSCDRDPTKCGCIDPNNCYIIKSLYPAGIPNHARVNVSIVGYFYPIAKQLYCVVQRQGIETVESFPVQFLHKNKTVIQCNIQLEQEGEYVLGLGFRKNVFITPPKDLLQLFVYDTKSVNITLPRPFKSKTNESESVLVIEFEDESQSIPAIPIKCSVLYESGQVEVSDFGTKPNSCILRASPLRTKSQKLKIYPTFDGVNIFPSYFEHLIEAPAPKLFGLSSFVSEDGLSIIINFEKPVDLDVIDRNIKDNVDDDDDQTMIMCDYLLLENTIEHLSLYGLESCRWATRNQLIITIIRPLSSDMIEIKFKSQILVEYNQKFASFNEEMAVNISKFSNSLNWWSYEPMIAVTGPSVIPECGEFALIGHFSSPRGSIDVDFQWSVNEEASDELKQYVARAGKSTNLLLSADMLEIGQQYNFVFRAFIQARRQSLEFPHTLIKVNYEAPIVSIYNSRLLQTKPLYNSDNVTLVADFKVPECIFPPQRIILSWRVTDPRFLFPLDELEKRFSVFYKIKPFSVPPNHTTSIMLNAFLGFNKNQTSEATFRFETIPAPLKSNIANGINKITIGSNSGMLRMASENNNRKRLVYQWSCHDTKSAQPCYFNFASAPIGYHRETILFTRNIQTKPFININSTWFQPNNQYLIGLQVFDANNSKITSETEYTLLNVVSGARPQVFVGPAFIKGKFQVPYNTRFSTHLIPSGTSLVIKGRAYLETGLKNIEWESVNFRYPLNWSSKRINKNEIHTQLYIHEDNLMAYGVYNFKLVACNHRNECSSSEIPLMATQSTTMCHVALDSYIELEMTFASIEKCSIAPSSSPVTYQLFLEDEHFPNLLPVTVPQLSPIIIFPGSPAFTDNQLTRLAVKVCDRFDTCTVHYSQPISVENTGNLTASIKQLIIRSKRFHKIGDSITAMSVLNSVFLKPDTLNESYTAYEAAINSTIQFGTSALQLRALTMSPGHYELVFNTLSFALHKTENLQLRRKLLDLIVKFFEKAEATESTPTMSSIRITYANVMNSLILEDKQTNNTRFKFEFFKDVRKAFRKIKTVAAAKMPLGSRVVLVSNHLDDRYVDSEGLPVKLHTSITEIVHLSNAFDVNIRARLNVNQSVSAKVQFGDEIKHNFSTGWDCGQEMPCSSIVYSVTVFPNENPFPSGKQNHKLSPVLDITIHAPKTGREQNVRGLFKATVFELTITGNATYGGSDYRTKCHYFDEDQQQWRMDDVHPLGIAYNQAGCWSGHLSSFVVLRTVTGISADYIIGVLVACLMGVMVFGIMLVFYVQKKREAAVAPEAENPKKTDFESPPKIARKPTHHNHIQTISNNDHFTPKLSHRPSSQNYTEIQSKTIIVTD